MPRVHIDKVVYGNEMSLTLMLGDFNASHQDGGILLYYQPMLSVKMQ